MESKRERLVRHVARMEGYRNIYICRALVGKPEGKRPHEIFKNRWEYNIKINLTREARKTWISFI
jgi:hypothetical protein